MPISDYHVVGDASLAQSPSGQTTIVIQTPDKANQLSYNNTSSGLSATNVQSAIDEVVENISEDTTVTTSTDSTPYLYRKSKAIGDREYLEYIDGGSLGWNQLVQNGNFADTSGWTVDNATFSVSSNEGTLTVTGSGNAYLAHQFSVMVNHIYYMAATMKCTSGAVGMQVGNAYKIYSDISSNYTQYAELLKPTGTNPANYYFTGNNCSNGDIFNIKKAQLIDLTLALGSTIADYVYSLEQATAGSGIAWLKEQGLFTDKYYAYDPGSIKSVNVSGHKMVGKNLVDISQFAKDYPTYCSYTGGTLFVNLKDSGATALYSNGISVKLPLSKFYFSCKVKCGTSSNIRIRIAYEDGTGVDVTTTTSATDWTTISGGSTTSETKRITSIRLNWSSSGTFWIKDFQVEQGTSATDYEPYEEHTYPITAIDLLGIPILTSDNKLGFDGDRYNANGRGDRKYGIVDLGSLNYTYDSSNLVFYATISGKAKGKENIICSQYATVNATAASLLNGSVTGQNGNSDICIKDLAYSDAATFKTALQNSNAQLVYEFATPTTENVTPIINPQICSPYGTEEFISDSPVPVPHSTEYYKIPDWMDVEPFKSERENNDSNTLKVAELANTRPELKSKALSGTTYANGNINSGLSNVIIVGVVFPRINNNYYVGIPFYGANNGAVWIHVMLDDCNTPANQLDVTGTLYYYEL